MRFLTLFILVLSINLLQILLPVRVKLTEEGRLSVVSSRLLMFNRVAKVGSKTLFKLLRTLGRVNGFKVGISNRREEVHIKVSRKIIQHTNCSRFTGFTPGTSSRWQRMCPPCLSPQSGSGISIFWILSLLVLLLLHGLI